MVHYNLLNRGLENMVVRDFVLQVYERITCYRFLRLLIVFYGAFNELALLENLCIVFYYPSVIWENKA